MKNMVNDNGVRQETAVQKEDQVGQARFATLEDLKQLPELLESKQVAAALALVRSYFASPNRKISVVFQIAEDFIKYGMVDVSEEGYQSILEIESFNTSALGRLGEIAQKRGDHRLAIDLFNKIIKHQSHPPSWAYIGLGNSFESINQLDDAVECLNKALLYDQHNEKLSLRIDGLTKQDKLKFLINKGEAFLKKQEYSEALPLFIEAAALDASHIKSISSLMDKFEQSWFNQKEQLVLLVKDQIAKSHYSPDWCYLGFKLDCLDVDFIGELIVSLCKHDKRQEALYWLRLLGDLKTESNKDSVKFYSNRFLSANKKVVREIPRFLTNASVNTASVDIVVCVHNALMDVQLCLNSVLKHSRYPYRIIIVNDGSAEPTTLWLESFNKRHDNCSLLVNKVAKGYTLAANEGLRESSADMVVLLNSDTIVTKGWLDKIAMCAFSSDRIGIVGPLSNTASWQSIPEICNDQGDWAENNLPPGRSIEWMGDVVESYSCRIYPRLPILNGFCLAIKRAVIDTVGIFDEVTFGKGFGEENDYCLRAGKFGWEMAVADDTYIHHSQSKSYGNEKRARLCEHADRQLKNKHTEEAVNNAVVTLRYDKVIEGVRARAHVLCERHQYMENARKQWAGKKVAFILPATTVSGGCHVVFRDALALLSMGIDVSIINFQCNKEACEYFYPDTSHLVRYVNTPDDIPLAMLDYDAVIGTLFLSVHWMKMPSECLLMPRRAYYVQDFEPLFFRKDSEEYKLAWDSYTLYPDLIRFTKTGWNRKMVLDHIGVDTHLVGSSVDIDIYQPRPKQDGVWPNRKLRILAMVRPSTPYRGPKMTMSVLKNIYDAYVEQVEICIFGCENDDLGFNELEQNFIFFNAGILNKYQVSRLMNESDIFLDCSTFQAMGLTAMEAMSTGLAVIAPIQGGASNFIHHNKNGLLVDTSDMADCITAVSALIEDHELRERLQRHAIHDMCQFSPEKCAYQIMDALFGNTIL